MSRVAFMVRLTILLLLISVCQAQETSDVIRLVNGQEVRGEVTDVKSGRLVLLEKSQYGSVIRQIQLDQISEVQFHRSDQLAAGLASATSVASLEKTWATVGRFLSVPKSPAGAVGLRLARLLLDANDAERAKRAGEILEKIELTDWDLDRRDQAGKLRFEATLGSAAAADAIVEAERALANRENPSLRSVAASFLAGRAIEEYRVLVTENPRWEQDPFIRPERDRLFFRAVDLLLVPYLDAGNAAVPAAASLWTLAQFLNETGEDAVAREVVQDIVTIYPETAEAAPAGELLSKIKPKNQNQ